MTRQQLSDELNEAIELTRQEILAAGNDLELLAEAKELLRDCLTLSREYAECVNETQTQTL